MSIFFMTRWSFGTFLFKSFDLNNGVPAQKSFTTKSNRNKHEKLKEHGPTVTKTRILFDETSRLYAGPRKDRNVQSGYKSNVLKHLKPCDSIWKKRKSVANNKICSFCSKVFAQKSNRDRHVEAVHHNDLSSSEEDSVVKNSYIVLKIR